ncbi:MAG: AraC family transcriptional regulator [Oscillospiraceae bacterium]|nr:AraC family transcriptional regulator [Oscillospiraceae bacterium]
MTQVVYNYFNVRMICAVGCKVEHPMKLCESYYSARLCLTSQQRRDEAVAFFDGKPGNGDPARVFDMALYKCSLIRAFEEQDADTLEQLMNQIIDSIRIDPSRQLQAMDAACNLLFLCLSQFTGGEEIISQTFSQEPEGYRCIYRQRSTMEIADWVSALGDGLVRALRSQKRGYKDQIIRQIKAYIQSNLDQRLSLNNVAAVFGFSPNYLSQLFARQAGCSFVEYVTREKIRAAKEMMREDSVKFYEIAERLGFENAFYFSKVFKKIEGCSPREYVQRRGQKGVLGAGVCRGKPLPPCPDGAAGGDCRPEKSCPQPLGRPPV